MIESSLFCILDQEFLRALVESAEKAGLKVKAENKAIKIEELEAWLPDLFLLDMELAAELGPAYLEEIAHRFPSIRVIILANSDVQEELLCLTLKSGGRGWIFKDDPQKVMDELLLILEQGYFFKPFAAQYILDEFKETSQGEKLLVLEEEILRLAARGLSLSQIQENLNITEKTLQSQWESIWQKLNINARASAQMEIKLPKQKSEEIPAAISVVHENILQFVVFRLLDEEFALSIAELLEVQRILPMTPLPRVRPYMKGIINLRGRIVPVIDLRIKVGFEPRPLTKESRLLIVGSEQKTFALMVDSVNAVMKIDASSLEPVSSFDYINAVIRLENRLIPILNLEKVLESGEVHAQASHF